MFDNVHEEVADLRMRVEKLEALFNAGKAEAQAKAHADLQAGMDAHDEPVQPVETTDGEAHHEESEQTSSEVVRGPESELSDPR